MERFFNIAWPCFAAKHYMLPATERLPEVPSLIRKELYFVIHAPRQSGKTTALYEKSHEKACAQVLRYMGRLGVSEGWLVVADSDLTKPWDDKISSEDIAQDGKMIHLIRC